MTIENVTWCSISLSCEGVIPSDVVLCVPTVRTANNSGFVNASLTSVSGGNACNSSKCYTFEYDATQLNDPTIPLTSAEVFFAFCLNCFTDWILYQIAHA